MSEKNIEMIHVKDINTITGYIRGGCSPVGMKKNYTTVIHESVNDFDEIIVSGGKTGIQILLSPIDLIRVTGAVTGDIIMKKE